MDSLRSSLRLDQPHTDPLPSFSQEVPGPQQEGAAQGARQAAGGSPSPFEKKERERKRYRQKLKPRKENEVPTAMLQNMELERKRSKLVLHTPQISDMVLQQVMLGRASEMAKEIAGEGGIETTDALLAGYSITPHVAATLRTPAPYTDHHMKEDSDAMETSSEATVEDQADVDARLLAEQEVRPKRELEKRSQVIQRSRPRPTELNTKILRQQAEELIKRQMITMQAYDSVKDPVPVQSQHKLEQLQSYFKANPYENISQLELARAKQKFAEKMEVVKKRMLHAELHRYTRANLASKKDRLESAEKRMKTNRRQIAKEAKRCGKIDKKLKILIGDYQARAKVLIKQPQDTYGQIEQNSVALSTFRFLGEQLAIAVPRRFESLQEEVRQQMDREKELQQKYASLVVEKALYSQLEQITGQQLLPEQES
ncbi:cell division cycle 5-like protein [Drosophila ficusphila]|uniref:cell division cycle 5-like protein n=1 Tax=Drosophila ficusphila TaxID=30025 RepID=UPI001C89E8E5|nr:cell division cycle 5-like protein [Drosophila ficusphila]